ncbi:MAG: 16S rRNA (adenine(1518)-N(6)/adenine(1519)-N(6))-dimethyltransferase RsmA, partial [Acidobacteria bacterium]|nr:16S rRNA (adenine(1518)-N(6)/adenine(1519)-N(6))-dimethyltransferase RsmA [Acidobacteriota bacterium]
GRIVGALSAGPGELIVEIGPGEGALTEQLADLGHPLRLIEIDPLLVDRLRARFEGESVEVIHGDALDVELPETPFRAVGNLPYNVANPIIRRVLSAESCSGAVFMIQREVAERYTASPGDPAYGFLTVVTRLYAEPRVVLKLGPGSFFPRPKVSSAVVKFQVRDPKLTNSRSTLEEIMSMSFRQRRKKLSNNLSGWNGLEKADVERAMNEAGLDDGTRAETLGLDDFDRLATALLR